MKATRDPIDKWILDRVPAALDGTRAKTFELQTKYEDMKPLFEKAGGMKAFSAGEEKACKIVKKMQDIEAEIRELWRPWQHVVGPCKECGGVREPGLMPEGSGFGCATCHDFEVIIRKKTA